MKALHIGAALLLGTSALAGTLAAKTGYEEPAVWDLQPQGEVSQKFSDPSKAAYSPDVKGPLPTTLAMNDSDKLSGYHNDQIALIDDPAGTGAPVDTMDATTMQSEAAPVQTAALDLSPRPATQNYPACDPGPGDDSCIQLYEPGVQTALASWNGQTGGFAGDGAIQTAMGGPEEDMAADPGVEPVETAYAEEPAPVETAYTDAPTNLLPGDTAEESQSYTGVGGPVSETGYPPCSGAESDDRCIQLYEPGVTGEGN